MEVETGQPKREQNIGKAEDARLSDPDSLRAELCKFMQVRLHWYAAAVEAATTFRNFHRFTALRMLTDFERTSIAKDLHREASKELEMLEIDFRNTAEELREVSKIYAEEKGGCTKQKNEIDQLLKFSDHHQSLMLDSCTQLMARIRQLEGHLHNTESAAALRKVKVRDQVLEMENFEEQIKEQRHRAQAARQQAAARELARNSRLV
jgi:hypothetical protein